ncbi:MAG: hypothetical protein E7293_09240 [Lachnospiraceae bacterium]|nr:hypothetical protein [Lachnospiraceae bacterium]
MIKTYAMLMEELSEYRAPANKLGRMVKEESCVQVIRGLYETEKATSGYLLAGSIYGPSYLSFEFALSRYGMIPEAVYVFTSATFEKKKAKKYDTDFGTFTYRDVPSDVYSYGIQLEREGDYIYQIATPEKALCDKLYTLPPVNSKKEMVSLLFEDLRIDEAEFAKLQKERMLRICEAYRSTNMKILAKIVR